MKLDEITIGFMAACFSHDKQLEMYRSFELFELFGELYYEDQFIAMLSSPDLDGMERNDKFEQMVHNEVVKVLAVHEISVNPDVPLKDVNEVLSCLFLIQHLEDYSYLQYRLSSMIGNELVLSDILGSVSTYDNHKFLTIIAKVSDNFMKILNTLVSERVVEETYQPDQAHEKMVKNLFSFVNSTPTIGGGLLAEGVGLNNTLQQLINILPYELSAVLTERASKDPIQVALDITTFIMMGKDTYQVPIVSYKKFANLFLNTPLLITQIEPIVTKIIIDANTHLEMKSKEEVKK